MDKRGFVVLVFLLFGSYFLRCGNQVFAQSLTATTIRTEEKTEVSERCLSLDLKDADLKDVLRLLSREYGLNIVAGKDVEGIVTITFVDIPVREALKAILEVNGYTYRQEGAILKVISLSRITPEPMPPLIAKAFTLNYLDAKHIIEAVSPVTSKYGKIKVLNRSGADKKSDTLIIIDTAETLERIASLIKELDTAPLQVRINAKIIEVTLSEGMDLGINWNIKASATGAIKPTGLPFEDFPSPEIGDFTFGTLDFSEFTATMEALETSGKSNLLSNPQVTVLDNEEAEIIIGKVIPIAKYELVDRGAGTSAWTVTGYEEKDIGIKLTVTPHINKDGYITMEVIPDVSEIVEWVTFQDAQWPVTSTRRATTQVRIKDGQTLVIGGLLKETKIKGNTGIPFLSRIPILGYLFGKKSTTEGKTDLLIFITPHILTEKSIKNERATGIKETRVAKRAIGD